MRFQSSPDESWCCWCFSFDLSFVRRPLSAPVAARLIFSSGVRGNCAVRGSENGHFVLCVSRGRKRLRCLSYQNKSVMSTFDMSHNIFLIHFPGLSGWLCFPKTMDMWCWLAWLVWSWLHIWPLKLAKPGRSTMCTWVFKYGAQWRLPVERCCPVRMNLSRLAVSSDVQQRPRNWEHFQLHPAGTPKHVSIVR